MQDNAQRDREILGARARALAREKGEKGAAEGDLAVVEFALADERYAVESRFVAEVFPFHNMTPVPGTPAFVFGIINVRGKIVSVIDLKVFFELPPKGLTDRSYAIILESNGMEFGILVDAMGAARRISSSGMQDGLPTLSGIREKYLKGITNDGMVVLDGGKLLSDEALVVRDE